MLTADAKQEMTRNITNNRDPQRQENPLKKEKPKLRNGINKELHKTRLMPGNSDSFILRMSQKSQNKY